MAEQLTIYIAEGDRTQGTLLHQALMTAARQAGMGGMTVMQTACGYGPGDRSISVDWMPECAPDLTLVLTVIDQSAAIEQYIPQVKALVHRGLVVQNPVIEPHSAPGPTVAQPTGPSVSLGDVMTDFERLTIYVGESDQWNGKPIHLALIEAARVQGLMGATVVRGVTGYGKRNHHRIKLLGILELSSDLPMVATLIDRREKIEQFLPIAQQMVTGGIVIREPVTVVHHAPVDESR